MQRVFDWIQNLFFFPFQRLMIAVCVAFALFLLLVGSSFALPAHLSVSAEGPLSDPDWNQIGFTIQSTDTLDTAYPSTPDEQPEGNGREEAEAPQPPAGYVAPDEPVTASDASQTDCTLEAEFVEGTAAVNELTLAPGEPFTGIWLVRNIGTCVWDDTYSVQAVQNNPIGLVPIPVPIPSVAPGDEFEIQLSLVAPNSIGPHLGAWQLQGPSLDLFGPLLSAQVLVVEEGALPQEDTTDTQASESATPAVLTDTPPISGTVPVPLETPTETAAETPTATTIPTEVPSATTIPTEVPSATPTQLPTASPTEVPSATTTPIEVPTNTPTVIITATSTVEVVSEGDDEGGITSFLASLPAPLQNPLVLALVVLIPLLFVVLLVLILRLLRQSGPPAPPAPVSSNGDGPTHDPSSGGSTSFARPADSPSLSQNTSFDRPDPLRQAEEFKPPVTPIPAPIAQQVVDVPTKQIEHPSPVEAPTRQIVDPPSTAAQPVDTSFAPWDSGPSSFAPRSASVTPVSTRPPAPASFRPAVGQPSSATANRLPNEPMAPMWSNQPIESIAFPSEPPASGTPYLQSLGRPAGVVYFPLTKRMIKVGRGAENDLVVDESFIGWQTVSRRHAELERDGQDIFLFDLGTTNGVRINGQQTGSHLLQKDCTISFGQLQFAFRMNKE